MLYLLISWIILIFVCWLIGLSILNFLRGDCFQHQGDRFIISVWLGIVTLAIFLLTISLFFPLSPLVGGVFAVSLIGISLSSKRIRAESLALKSMLNPRIILGFFTLELIIAALINQQMIWFDSGLYHIGSIRWLSEFGAVPGVALINPKFGFTSSWFAFAAPWVPNLLGSRIGAITNGFVFFIATIQLFIILNKFFQKDKKALFDYFIFIYLLTIILVYSLIIFRSPIIISFSPDVPITFLIGIIAWSLLIIANYQNNSELNARAIPLILSLGALTIKLSALPLVPVAVFFYISSNNFKIQRILWASVILILCLLPMVAFGMIASGCPFYPSTLMCQNFPWSIGVGATTMTELNAVKGWANAFISFEGIIQWLTSSLKSQLIVLIFILSLIIFISCLKIIFKERNKSLIWVLILGILGMSFIITQSPLLRFGIGYFMLIPSLGIAKYLEQQKNKKILGICPKKLFKITLLLPLLLMAITLINTRNIPVQSRWLLPPELPSVNLKTGTVNDIKYYYPANWFIRCWASELPCSALPIRQNIKLRNPKVGIAAGFVNIN